MANHIDNAVLRKAPPGWLPYKYQSVDGCFLVSGSVPVGVMKSGPRKGKPKWDMKLERIFVISREELDAERKRYEAETGNCENCFGEGQEFASWSKKDGTKTRDCRTCKGTGKAKAAEAPKP